MSKLTSHGVNNLNVSPFSWYPLTIQLIKTFNSILLELTGNNGSSRSPPAPRQKYQPMNNTCYFRLPNAPWVCQPVPSDKGSLIVILCSHCLPVNPSACLAAEYMLRYLGPRGFLLILSFLFRFGPHGISRGPLNGSNAAKIGSSQVGKVLCPSGTE